MEINTRNKELMMEFCLVCIHIMKPDICLRLCNQQTNIATFS